MSRLKNISALVAAITVLFEQFKVLLISKYIADIPHFLENVIGVPGSMKTN